jgi:hypothetical protein
METQPCLLEALQERFKGLIFFRPYIARVSRKYLLGEFLLKDTFKCGETSSQSARMEYEIDLGN